MDIRSFMNLDMLQHIQDSFSKATGVAAIAVDSQGQYLTRGSNFTDFCMKYTRNNPEGARRCQKCDTECKGTYFCHAGLMDFSSDIIVDGERVGAIIGGQVLPCEPEEEKFRSIARELGIPEDEYIYALRKVPVRSEEQIRAAASMLGEVVNQLVNLEYFKSLNSKKMAIFDEEMANAFETIKEIQNMTRSLQKCATMENILSINASVEAARAGAVGVGFAVLAKEIGQLSAEASGVYQNIYDSVESIRVSITKMSKVELRQEQKNTLDIRRGCQVYFFVLL